MNQNVKSAKMSVYQSSLDAETHTHERAQTSSCLLSFLSLYGRHMQANPEPPKKSNDKSKKISRKPLAAKNK